MPALTPEDLDLNLTSDGPGAVIQSVDDALVVMRWATQPAVWAHESMKIDWQQVGPTGSRVFASGIWYRGKRMSRPLEPKVFLPVDTASTQRYEESAIIKGFSYSTTQDVRPAIQTPLDLLCTAQHFGLPTRLLDWTTSILVALYFAVGPADVPSTEDGELVVLNARLLSVLGSPASTVPDCPGRADLGDALGRPTLYSAEDFAVVARAVMAEARRWDEVVAHPAVLAAWSEDTPRRGSGRDHLAAVIRKAAPYFAYPVPVVANQNNPRVVAQQGRFTIGGGKRLTTLERARMRKVSPQSELPPVTSLEAPSLAPCLKRTIVVPKHTHAALRSELHQLGFSPATMFPGLDGVAASLRHIWRST